MDRNAVAQLLIEARTIAGQNDFVIGGSAAILGKVPNPPRQMTSAANINFFPRDIPDLGSRRVHDLLGIGSAFHRRNHFYGEPTSPWLATLPNGWEHRMTRVDVAPNLRAWFIDANDVAISKYARGNQRDRAWIRAGLDADLLSLETIKERLPETVTEVAERFRIEKALTEDTAWLADARRVIRSEGRPQVAGDDAGKGRKLLTDIETASEHFKRYMDRGQLKLGHYYLTEYQRAIDRAARAGINGNQQVISASIRNSDLRLAMERMRHRAEVIASEPLLHLNFNHEGDRLETEYGEAVATGHGKTRRKLFDGKLGALREFEELYHDVTRTSQQVPIGALHRHALARLKQSYGVLLLVEQARDAGIIPGGARFVATGAKVQDKTTSKEYPAAHRLPCDLSARAPDGTLKRLSDYFKLPIDTLWVDKHLFAPTDKVHRLANVADRWCEDVGMIEAMAKAATAVAQRQMSAEDAMTEIVEPGYAEAVNKSLSKVERNFTYLERQELRRRVVDENGEPYVRLPEPLVLHVKGLAERAVAKDLMEQTLHAYSAVTHLPVEERMRTAVTVSAIVENEKQVALGMHRPAKSSYERIRHSEDAWPHVRQWLIDTKGLSPALVDALRKSDVIAADGEGNLVARLHDRRGREVGAELFGTDPSRPVRQFAPGSREDAAFLLETQPGTTYTASLKYQEIVLVKDAMDALAYAEQRRDIGRIPALVASTGGLRSSLETHIVSDLARQSDKETGLYTRYAIAYDADEAGDHASDALAGWFSESRRVHWAVRRDRPAETDWTQSLASQQGTEIKFQQQPSSLSSYTIDF